MATQVAVSEDTTGATAGGHAAQFHGDDAELVSAVVEYLGDALAAGEGVAVIATPAHRLALLRELAAAGVDTRAAQVSGRLVVADARRTLARIMVGGHPDPAALQRVVDGFVARAGSGGTRPVRLFAEMAALLWETGRLEAAIELEELGNELVVEGTFGALCAYPALAVSGPERAPVVERLCRLHTAVRGRRPSESCRPTPEVAGESARCFDATAEAPGQARRFVAGALPPSEPELREAAQLVVTELATNAVSHARSAFSVAISFRPEVMRIAVRDTGPDDPVPRRPPAEATSGRGLLVVEAVARRWGVRRLPRGKTVWVEIPR